MVLLHPNSAYRTSPIWTIKPQMLFYDREIIIFKTGMELDAFLLSIFKPPYNTEQILNKIYNYYTLPIQLNSPEVEKFLPADLKIRNFDDWKSFENDGFRNFWEIELLER